jgi:hypothetical protein
MRLRAIYGIVIPSDAPFGQTEADAVVPHPFVVSDAFAGTTAPAFARLQLDEAFDVVSVSINGEPHDVLRAFTLPDTAVGLVVASHAMLAALDRSLETEPELVPGYLTVAAAPGYTYALAGVPERNVCGELPLGHPDVLAVADVVDKSRCRTS